MNFTTHFNCLLKKRLRKYLMQDQEAAKNQIGQLNFPSERKTLIAANSRFSCLHN